MLTSNDIVLFKSLYKSLHERAIYIRNLLKVLDPSFRDGAVCNIQYSGIVFHPLSMEHDEDLFIEMDVLTKSDAEIRSYIEEILEERRLSKEEEDDLEDEKFEKTLYEKLKERYG